MHVLLVAARVRALDLALPTFTFSPSTAGEDGSRPVLAPRHAMWLEKVCEATRSSKQGEH
jgi:hypothetical protein